GSVRIAFQRIDTLIELVARQGFQIGLLSKSPIKIKNVRASAFKFVVIGNSPQYTLVFIAIAILQRRGLVARLELWFDVLHRRTNSIYVMLCARYLHDRGIIEELPQ